jgi:hypothetical protein
MVESLEGFRSWWGSAMMLFAGLDCSPRSHSLANAFFVAVEVHLLLECS